MDNLLRQMEAMERQILGPQREFKILENNVPFLQQSVVTLDSKIDDGNMWRLVSCLRGL